MTTDVTYNVSRLSRVSKLHRSLNTARRRTRGFSVFSYCFPFAFTCANVYVIYRGGKPISANVCLPPNVRATDYAGFLFRELMRSIVSRFVSRFAIFFNLFSPLPFYSRFVRPLFVSPYHVLIF